MREFGTWKSRRDEIISAALALELPVERISAEMQVSESAIRRVKDRLSAPSAGR